MEEDIDEALDRFPSGDHDLRSHAAALLRARLLVKEPAAKQALWSSLTRFGKKGRPRKTKLARRVA